MATILLVDDDESFRTMMGITLERMGHQITQASDGAQALRLFQQDDFAVTLIDLIMPEKEGMETITEMRLLRPTAKIIAMSGGGRMNARDVLSIAKAIGVTQTLAKPFSNEELMAALNMAQNIIDA